LRVLITGGTGFIGSRVSAMAVARGHDVTILARHAAEGMASIVHDLAQAAGLTELVGGFDGVIHCAAAMGGSAEAQRSATVVGTRNLVEAMHAARVRRCVLVSSFAVYDYLALEPGDFLTEDTPLDQSSEARGPYIAAKRDQEQIVTGSPNLDWTVFRPGLVYGPGRTWFYHLGARHSNLWVTMSGAGILPLAHVDNCAEAIVAALDASSSVRATLNLVDDDLPTRTKYVKWLADRAARRPIVLDIPWQALNVASRGAWLATHGLLRDLVQTPGSLHPAVLAARCKPLRYDNSRARTVLQWSPRIQVSNGLRDALDATAG
jgi:2-alkyl-3-oxoalkanoate reductase